MKFLQAKFVYNIVSDVNGVPCLHVVMLPFGHCICQEKGHALGWCMIGVVRVSSETETKTVKKNSYLTILRGIKKLMHCKSKQQGLSQVILPTSSGIIPYF